MMATTEIDKVPPTIQSRSQVFELKTIGVKQIADQLRRIADAEGIQADDAAVMLLARAGDGSMRDAQSAFDQVISFAGTTITVDDVSTVLGLVGRDLLFDLLDAVVAEDAPAAFALADRAVEAGHDLKLVCRELSRVVRDLMIVSVDPSRAGDGDLVEGERDRITQLATRFSREDLMRAFDLLSKAEQDIRAASHPRYHFEMVLLKWMHLRKLVPLSELIEQTGGSTGPKRPAQLPTPNSQLPRDITRKASAAAPVPSRAATPEPRIPDPGSRIPNPGLKDSLLAEIRAKKGLFYNTVVAQAQKIEVTPDRVTFTFLPTHRALREQLELSRPWLEAAAEQIAGRKVSVVAVQSDALGPAALSPAVSSAASQGKAEAPKEKRDLKAEAMSSSTVQAMLDVFPAEIRDVEEM
jgi:DNA polymerase-3 subunit gamma/tau